MNYIMPSFLENHLLRAFLENFLESFFCLVQASLPLPIFEHLKMQGMGRDVVIMFCYRLSKTRSGWGKKALKFFA